MEVVIEPREALETESEQCRCHCQDVENVGKIFSSILSAKYKNLSNPVQRKLRAKVASKM